MTEITRLRDALLLKLREHENAARPIADGTGPREPRAFARGRLHEILLIRRKIRQLFATLNLELDGENDEAASPLLGD